MEASRVSLSSVARWRGVRAAPAPEAFPGTQKGFVTDSSCSAIDLGSSRRWPRHHTGAKEPLLGPQAWTLPAGNSRRGTLPHCDSSDCGFNTHSLISPICQAVETQRYFRAQCSCWSRQFPPPPPHHRGAAFLGFKLSSDIFPAAATVIVESALSTDSSLCDPKQVALPLCAYIFICEV